MIGELRLDGLKSCVYGNVCTLRGRQSSPCFVLLVFSAQETLEPFYGSLVSIVDLLSIWAEGSQPQLLSARPVAGGVSTQ